MSRNIRRQKRIEPSSTPRIPGHGDLVRLVSMPRFLYEPAVIGLIGRLEAIGWGNGEVFQFRFRFTDQIPGFDEYMFYCDACNVELVE